MSEWLTVLLEILSTSHRSPACLVCWWCGYTCTGAGIGAGAGAGPGCAGVSVGADVSAGAGGGVGADSLVLLLLLRWLLSLLPAVAVAAAAACVLSAAVCGCCVLLCASAVPARSPFWWKNRPTFTPATRSSTQVARTSCVCLTTCCRSRSPWRRRASSISRCEGRWRSLKTTWVRRHHPLRTRLHASTSFQTLSHPHSRA